MQRSRGLHRAASEEEVVEAYIGGSVPLLNDELDETIALTDQFTASVDRRRGMDIPHPHVWRRYA
jgi:hypothetical protein